MTEIIGDDRLEKLDQDLGAFLERERAMFATLVDRKMITAEQLHEMEWKSVEAVTEYMSDDEIFGLLAAIARWVRRLDLEGPSSGSTPFDYPFELGFAEYMRNKIHKWDDDEIEGVPMVVGLMRRYAKDTLWWLLDDHLMRHRVWDRLKEREEKEAA